MKRLSTLDKSLLINLAHRRHSHNLARKKKVYNPFRLKYAQIANSSNHDAPEPHVIDVPQTLDIEKKFDDSVKFIAELRKSGYKTNTPIKLDFSQCLNISPASMLLLLAHIHKIRLLRGEAAVTGTYPIDQKLDKKMCAMGFYDLLNIKNNHENPQTFPMEYIPFSSATRKPERFTENFKHQLFGENILIRTEIGRSFYAALTEALLNCLNHAYPEKIPKEKKIRNRWWLSGHYHQPSGRLHVMFCDLGVGIPQTLPRTQGTENLRKLLSNFTLGKYSDDGAMISAAMKIGRSKTGNQYRGKGLNDLRKFIEKIGAGKLIIYSNKGRYNYTLKDSIVREVTNTHNHSIYGTLIHWSVPIDKVVQNWNIGNINDQ